MNGATIEFRFETSKPVEVLDLAASLTSIGRQYMQFASAQGFLEADAKLYVKEIRSGSIIAELVGVATQIPWSDLVKTASTTAEFAKRVTEIIDWFRGKSKVDPIPSRGEMETTKGMLLPVVNDPSAQLTFNCTDNAQVVVNLTINSFDAAGVTQRISNRLKQDAMPVSGRQELKAFRWYQARNDLKAKTGDRGVIESISPKPVRVRFTSEAIKETMTKGPIFERVYIVDAVVETSDDKPMLYTIIHLHEFHASND